MHLTCGGAHASTRSLDQIMQQHRLSLQTSPLLASACSVAVFEVNLQCLLYTVFNDQPMVVWPLEALLLVYNN